MKGTNKMSEEIKDLNKQVDKLEDAAKKYASANTVISIGGYEFTPAKLMVAATIVSSTLGGLYGCFEVYKDYMGMKQKIAEYVSPDLTEIYKKLEVTDANTTKMVEYTQDIKNDLKNDIRRVEGVVEGLERKNATAIRDIDNTVKDVKKEVDTTVKDIKKDSDTTLKEVRRYSDQTIKEVNQEMTRNQKETQSELRSIRKEVDDKIKKALDNPLSN
jgi:outer membrane murein-binding lipoprotein Lpp